MHRRPARRSGCTQTPPRGAEPTKARTWSWLGATPGTRARTTRATQWALGNPAYSRYPRARLGRATRLGRPTRTRGLEHPRHERPNRADRQGALVHPGVIRVIPRQLKRSSSGGLFATPIPAILGARPGQNARLAGKCGAWTWLCRGRDGGEGRRGREGGRVAGGRPGSTLTLSHRWVVSGPP